MVDRAYRARETEVREIVARCRRLYPYYRAFTGPALEDLRQNVRYLVAGFYQRNLIEGRSPTLTELKPTLRMAQLRAVQGVPVGAMVGCYLLALPILWEHLIARVGTSAAVRLELLQRVPVTFESITWVTARVTEAYVEERDRLQRSRGEALDELLRLLLADDAPLRLVEARARALGVRLDVPRVAVLFLPAQETDLPTSDVEALQSLLATVMQPGEGVAGRIHDGVLALFPEPVHTPAIAEIAPKLSPRRWRIGVGTPSDDAETLRRSAREARRAIEIGALVRKDELVYRYAELTLYDLIDVGSSRAEEFARRVLGPLARPGAGQTYRRTLRALCTHGFHLKSAAAALGIHPHTMSYRLNQIRRRFGIDLADAETRLRVHLAVLIFDA